MNRCKKMFKQWIVSADPGFTEREINEYVVITIKCNIIVYVTMKVRKEKEIEKAALQSRNHINTWAKFSGRLMKVCGKWWLTIIEETGYQRKQNKKKYLKKLNPSLEGSRKSIWIFSSSFTPLHERKSSSFGEFRRRSKCFLVLFLHFGLGEESDSVLLSPA